MSAVLLLNTCSASHLASRLHAAACPMVASARASKSKVRVIEESVDAAVADLNERGFTVRRCKCLGKES